MRPARSEDPGRQGRRGHGRPDQRARAGSLADDDNLFRVVDCKYKYNLSIPSLEGAGTYRVKNWVDGESVPTPDSPNGTG